MLKRLLVGLFVASLATAASAQLIDRGSYLFDQGQRLDWLKLDATKNNSFARVMERTAAGGDLHGWNLASGTQIRTMFDGMVGSLGTCGPTTCLHHTSVFAVSQGSWVDPMFSAFGVSEHDSSLSHILGYYWESSTIYGLFASPHETIVISNAFGGYDGGIVDEGIFFTYPEMNGQSAFLIRSAVPESSTILLLMLGLLALASHRVKPGRAPQQSRHVPRPA